MTEAPTAPVESTATPDSGSPDYLSAYESDFAAMDEAPPEKQPDAKPDPKVKPDDAPEDTPEEITPPKKPDAKPDAKPDDKKPADKTEPVKPVKAADLRTAHEKLKKRVQEEYEPQLQTLKAKVQELESRKPAEDPAPVMAKLTALEKRNEELERHIQYVDYTKSQEFTKKYEEPYQEAWQEATAEFRELTVREPDGVDEMEEPKFRTRPADENDLLKLANMRLSDMDAAATEMFGHSAARAIAHIQNLKRLSKAQNLALDEAKTKAKEWTSQRSMESQGRAKAMAEAWQGVNKSLEEKFPKAFQVDASDPDDAAAHAVGFALADLMFAGVTPDRADSLPQAFRDTVKAGKPLSDAQRVQLHAIVRLKAANHDRKVVALKKATARIAELEKSLAEYEKSAPRAGKAGESNATDTGKDWMAQAEDEIGALDKG